MDPDMKEAARDLIARMTAEHEEDMDSVALGWIVLSHDDEVDAFYAMGVFDTPEAATAFAVKHGEEMNRDVEEGEGWTMTVHRLMPVSK